MKNFCEMGPKRATNPFKPTPYGGESGIRILFIPAFLSIRPHFPVSKSLKSTGKPENGPLMGPQHSRSLDTLRFSEPLDSNTDHVGRIHAQFLRQLDK